MQGTDHLTIFVDTLVALWTLTVGGFGFDGFFGLRNPFEPLSGGEWIAGAVWIYLQSGRSDATRS